MKKAKKLFVAVMLVMAAFMMSGCALFDLFNSVGPKNKWMEYDYVYNDCLFEIYMYYTDNPVELPSTLKDITFREIDPETGYEVDNKTRTLPAGLTVVVNPSADAKNNETVLKEVLGTTMNTGYVAFAVKNGTSLDMTAEETGREKGLSGISMGYTTWLTISLCTTDMDSVGKNGPACMKVGSGVDQITVENFNWKRILAAVAIDKLMEMSK